MADGLLNGANLVAGLIQNGERARGLVNNLFDEAAQKRAAQAMIRGDYEGAAGTLASRGMIQPAATMQALGTDRDVLTAINSGDYTAARAAAARGGDRQAFGTVETAEANDQKERLAWMGRAADALAQIKDPAARTSAFTGQIAPVLKSMGVPDDALAQIAENGITDDELMSFRALMGDAQGFKEVLKTEDGNIVGVDEQGNAKILYQGGRSPKWVERTLPDGSTEWVDLNAVDSGGEAVEQPVSRPPAPKGGVYDRIAATAAQIGADEDEQTYLRRLAQVESSGNPNARNGSSTGVFQFQPATFEEVGGGDINSVEDQTRAALNLARRDRARLEQLGLPADPANLYIMHQQGAGGGPALLTAPPETGAVEALVPVYGNRERARAAIVRNGGREDMTAGEFVQMWRDRFSGGARAAEDAGVPASAGSARRSVPGSAPKAREWQDLPGGGQINIRTGEKKNVPRVNEKITDGQRQSAAFMYRALQANDRLNRLAEQKIYKPETATAQLFDRDKNGVVRIVTKTAKDRQFIQAAKEFLAPILRKDTGAAVTDEELNTYMDIYIPRYEDDQATMWQKAQARDAAMRALYGQGRVAYDAEYGAPKKWRVLAPGAQRSQSQQTFNTPYGRVVVRPK